MAVGLSYMYAVIESLVRKDRQGRMVADGNLTAGLFAQAGSCRTGQERRSAARGFLSLQFKKL